MNGAGNPFSPLDLAKDHMAENALAGSSNGAIPVRDLVSAAITEKLATFSGALANLLHSVAVTSKAFSETLSNPLMDLPCAI